METIFKTISLTLVFVLLISFPLLASDQGIQIEAKGYGVIEEDLANALDVAIRDAMRRGVEQALGSYVDSHTLIGDFGMVEDSILSKSTGYVSSYNIHNQIIEDGLVTVVLVMMVKQSDLQNDVDALALALQRKGNPRVLVVIPKEQRGYLEPNSSSEKVIIEQLIDHGFQVVTDQPQSSRLDRRMLDDIVRGDSSARASLGKMYEADLLVVGKASAKQIADVYGMLSYQGKVEVQAIDLATHKVLTSFEADEVELDISPGRATDKALKAAGENAAEHLISTLARRFVAENATLSLEITGLTFSDLLEIEARLKRVRLTESVFIRDFQNDRAKLEVTTALTAMQLANEIQGSGWRNFSLKVISVAGGTLELQKR